VISIFGSPSSTRLFFQDSNSQTFCLPECYAGTTMNPQKKMIELNFAISNKFAKTSTSSGENTHEEKI
jgi:hypothetical protein